MVQGGSPFELRRRTAAGLVFAAGVELRAPFLKFSPEVRYGHRFSENFQSGGLLRSNRNQFDFLLGITF